MSKNYMKSPVELEIQELERDYAKLGLKRELLNEQIEGEVNEDTKDTLCIRRENIKKKMAKIWRRLDELKCSSSDSRYQYLTFKKDLPRIDFDEAMDAVGDLIRSFRQDHEERGDLLLLLQKSFSMAGDLCLRRIQEEFERETGHFTHIPVEFYFGNNLNEYGWLEQLGEYYGITGSNPKELAKAVIEKLCQSVKIGSIVWLEIRKWDDLPCQEETLAWFMEYFWIPLVNRLNDSEKYSQVKFISVIVADAELSPACFKEKCLCEIKVAPFRWLKLPLRNWTQEEIKVWLERYPAIGNPRSTNLSKRLFTVSEQGIPSMVCLALERELILTKS